MVHKFDGSFPQEEFLTEIGDSPLKFASLLAHTSSSTDGFYPLQCLSNMGTLTKSTLKIGSRVGKELPSFKNTHYLHYLNVLHICSHYYALNHLTKKTINKNN